MRFSTALSILTLVLAPAQALMPAAFAQAGTQAAVTPQAAEFFEKKVRPLLVDNCVSCHGESKANGGLRLDSLNAILKGGDSGTALVPGNAAKSRIIKAIAYNSELKMPPSGKMSADAIATLTQWVTMGAPWPGAKPTAPQATNGEYVIPDEMRKWWSFKPVTKPVAPPVKAKWWVKSPIDSFILAKLEQKNLKPSPFADRRTLIRRASFDLTGLPPTPEAVDTFVADKRPDAFARVVDSLLASPQYGERWGRHWLDIARYADTKGYAFTEDPVYHNAYTYRDYVIRSFNEDLPYDQFVVQQLAADKLDLGEDKRPLAALGFLNVGRRFLNDPVFINDDRIDCTCRGLLGLTVGCARCHNHKFDPVSMKDYYALYGVFASSFEPNPPPAISPKTVSGPFEAHNAQILNTERQVQDQVRNEMTQLRARVEKDPAKASAEVKQILQSIRLENLPDAGQLTKLMPAFNPAAAESIKKLQAAVADLRAHMPPTPEFAMATQDLPKPFDAYVFLRGNPGNRGDAVPRRFIQLLSGEGAKPYTDGGRLQLAQDIANKSNPLTARVFVNRVWMYHFGQAIVRTPSDFGTRGEKPTNPALLDWLASSFMEDGWSIKKLHRRIMLSSAYQQSCDGSQAAFNADPENRLVYRQNRQRLDFESLRDTMLAVSGKLDKAVGGPAVEITKAPFSARRTVYGFIDRQNLQPLFRAFDFASPDSSSAQRFNTTVPQQSLFMMNSPFIVEQAKALAARPEVAGAKTVTAQVTVLYKLLYQRAPVHEEIAAAESFLRGLEQLRQASTTGDNGVRTASFALKTQVGRALSPLEEYAQTLLLTNELLFVD
jgi:hypothetical protein